MSLSEQQPEFDGGFYVESNDEIEAGVNVTSKLEDVFLTVSTLTTSASSNLTLSLNDDQIGDLQIALGLAKQARAEAKRRRLLGMAA